MTLFARNPDLFNRYAHFLLGFGWLLVIIELVLVAGFVFHSAYGTVVWLNKRRARTEGYVETGDAGHPSRKTFSSKTMIWTGIVLGVFIVTHVITFKYGPGVDQGYVTVINGEEVRDLYRLVVDIFTNEYYVAWYVLAMIITGFHLRHAFWSAFQSLGTNTSAMTPILFWAGTLLAILLALGFLVLPIFIYVTHGGSL